MSEDDDPVSRWSVTPTERSQHGTSVEWECAAQPVPMQREHGTVTRGVCDQEDQDIQAGVALFQRRPPCDGLDVEELSLGLDADTFPKYLYPSVKCSQVAWNWHRHLGFPWRFRRQTRS